MVLKAFVIKSGNGFLRDPETLEMVGHRDNPADAMSQAKRYPSRMKAYGDFLRMRRAGFDCEIFETWEMPGSATAGEC